jgi:hypothetical protein
LFSVIGAVPSVVSQLFGLYGGHISIVTIISVALIVAVAALFRARASSRLGITRDGIEVPSIDGRKVVRWCDVTKVRRDGREIVIHHSGRQKVLVNPSVYRNSDEIAEYVLARLRENGKVL